MATVKTDLDAVSATVVPFRPRSDIPASTVQAAIEYLQGALGIGTDVQAWSARLDEIAALAITDGNIIVGNGSGWVAESGATARASLGVSIGSQVQAWAAVLDATTAAFTTADETKIDYLTVTGATDLDTIRTKAGHITVTQAVDLDAIETRVNALDAAVVLSGTWDASAGTFPGGGTAQAGQSYIVSVGGTVNGQVFVANDRIVAILDNASTTTYAANWHKLDYTDQVLSVDGATGAVSLSSTYQGKDATLTALAAYNSNGMMTQTAADTFAARTITGTANQVDVTNGNGVSGNPTLALPVIQRTRSITYVIDGGGATITTGIKGDLRIPFACTIVGATALADQSGAIVVDVWKDTYTNFPPTDADTITASAPVTITASGTKSEDNTLTGWTTAIAADDILRFNVDSVTSIQRLTISLEVTV
jgi:hypothetical protein